MVVKASFQENSRNVVITADIFYLKRAAKAVNDCEKAVEDIWNNARRKADNEAIASIDIDTCSDMPDVVIEQIKNARKELAHSMAANQRRKILKEIDGKLNTYKFEIEKLMQSSNEVTTGQAKQLIAQIKRIKNDMNSFVGAWMTFQHEEFTRLDY